MNSSAGTLFEIGTLSSLSGVNTSTIRTWENRYGALAPAKNKSGRRLYTNSDVNRLILLKNLLARGYRISALAGLPTEQLQELAGSTPTVPAVDTPHMIDDRLLSALNDQDLGRFRRALTFSIGELSPLDAVTRVFQPVLTLIGDRWHRGEIDVAQEHMLSEAVRAQLLNMIDGLKVTESGPLVAFAALSREQHEFGALMACFLASSLRFRTVYFGANLPPQDLANFAKRASVDLIVVSSVFVEDANLPEIQTLCSLTGPRTPVWLGCDQRKIAAGSPLPKSLTVISSFPQYLSHLRNF